MKQWYYEARWFFWFYVSRVTRKAHSYTVDRLVDAYKATATYVRWRDEGGL